MSDRKKHISRIPEDIEESINLVSKSNKSNGACIFAFGQTAVPAEIVSEYANNNSEKLVSVITDGRIPSWINEKIDVVIISCGDDDKAIKILETVKERKCTIHCIATKGKFLSFCKDCDVYEIPKEYTSIAACGFVLGLLSGIIQEIDVCNVKDSLEKIIDDVKKDRDSLENINEKEFSFLENGDTSFYGTADMIPVLRRFAYNNTDVLGHRSFRAEMPEFDHNELVGWCMSEENIDNLTPVILLSETDDVLGVIVKSVVETMNEYGRNPVTIGIPYENVLRKNIYGVMLADTIYSKLSGGKK